MEAIQESESQRKTGTPFAENEMKDKEYDNFDRTMRKLNGRSA